MVRGRLDSGPLRTAVTKGCQVRSLELAGVIDFEEFVKESPKALRVNLVKLAKANGHDLGFLA